MSGFPVLLLEYCPILKNWDQVVEEALRKRGLQRGKVQIIYTPKNSKSSAMAKAARPLCLEEILADE